MRTKRENNTGSIVADKTINRYIVKWTDENNVRHKKTTFPLTREGKKDAEKFLQEINRKKAERVSTAKMPSLGDWMVEYITTYRKPNLKERSLRRLVETAKLLTPLAETSLDEVTPRAIQRLLNKLRETHSGSTVSKIYKLLNAAYKQAIAERILLINPMLAVPHVKVQKADIKIFTSRELGIVFHTLRKMEKNKQNRSQLHDYRFIFLMLLTTGMRIGELLALRWENVNLEKRVIHVNSSKSMTPGQRFNSPKTESGKRYIPILWKKTYTRLCANRQKSGFVFANKNGGAIEYQRVYLTWERVKSLTGLTQTIHCFRHTFASYLLEQGIPILEVRRIMGHSDASTTLNMYGHSIENYFSNMMPVTSAADIKLKKPKVDSEDV